MRQFIRFLWAIPPLLVLASVVLVFHQKRQVPARGDWEAATEHIRAHLEEGDGVAWAPYWAGEGRLFLHGLPGFHLLDLQEADLARYDRVWLMGAFGRDASDLPPEPEHARLETKAFGPLTLDLIKVAGPKVLGDFRAELHNMQVSRVDQSGAVEACDFWDGRGWHCQLKKSPAATRRCLEKPTARRLADFRGRRRGKDPHCGLNPWLHVSRDVRVIGEGPRRCIWMHPVKGKTVKLVWPAAPGGDELVIDYGFTDKILTFRSDRDGPARTQPAQIVARQGDEKLGRLIAKPEPGWHRWSVKMGAAAAPVTLELTSRDQADAWLCLDPTIRGGR